MALVRHCGNGAEWDTAVNWRGNECIHALVIGVYRFANSWCCAGLVFDYMADWMSWYSFLLVIGVYAFGISWWRRPMGIGSYSLVGSVCPYTYGAMHTG